MRAALVCLLLFGACSSNGTSGGSAPAPKPDAAIAHVVVAPIDATAACATDADAQARDADAELDRTELDLDGDGVLDPVFRSCTNMRCSYLVYGSAGAPCPRFAGELAGSILGGPYCSEPPSNGRPCQLSVMRMMIHGDAQEYLYGHDGTTYVELGHGDRYVAPRKKRP